jgi:hypothetical protein
MVHHEARRIDGANSHLPVAPEAIVADVVVVAEVDAGRSAARVRVVLNGVVPESPACSLPLVDDSVVLRTGEMLDCQVLDRHAAGVIVQAEGDRLGP